MNVNIQCNMPSCLPSFFIKINSLSSGENLFRGKFATIKLLFKLFFVKRAQNTFIGIHFKKNLELGFESSTQCITKRASFKRDRNVFMDCTNLTLVIFSFNTSRILKIIFT